MQEFSYSKKTKILNKYKQVTKFLKQVPHYAPLYIYSVPGGVSTSHKHKHKDLPATNNVQRKCSLTNQLP